VADESELPVKLYYRIGEVSQIVGVEPHVLRYWETEFRSIRPQKSRKGQRIYSRRDVDKLLKVKDLLYTHGFTIAGARRRLREAVPEAEPQPAPVPQPAPPSAPEAELSFRARGALVELRDEIKRMLSELEGEAS
jgi:DNA-binding transcriptional MerR regulator